MKLKQIVIDFFEAEEKKMPSWLNSIETSNGATLSSWLFETKHCQKIRICELKIKQKFYAESLVIYPQNNLQLPIFGSEFLNISNKRYFGAIDFHPTKNSDISYLKYLEYFPDTKIDKLNHYDLTKFFSKKLWIKKDKNNFYDEYEIWIKCYLHQYKKILKNSNYNINYNTEINCYKEYNQYMSDNDPAFGILRSYFDRIFAEKYIRQFLFC